MALRMALFGLMGVGVSVALASCVTLEKDECAVANWHELGRADGEQGRNVTRAANYREDCAKFGIPIDDRSYRAGWDLGIRQYCTPQNGFDRGIKGRSYANSCPAGLAVQFEQPYGLGQEIHDLDRDIGTIQRKIDRLNLNLDVDGLPKDARQILRRDRRALRRERDEYRLSLSGALAEARQRGFNVNY